MKQLYPDFTNDEAKYHLERELGYVRFKIRCAKEDYSDYSGGIYAKKWRCALPSLVKWESFLCERLEAVRQAEVE